MFLPSDFGCFGIDNLGDWALISTGVLAVSYGVASLSWYRLEKPVRDRAHTWQPHVEPVPHRECNAW